MPHSMKVHRVKVRSFKPEKGKAFCESISQKFEYSQQHFVKISHTEFHANWIYPGFKETLTHLRDSCRQPMYHAASKYDEKTAE